MTRTTDTRARMIRTAAELFRRQGYAATGWREIVAASATPWGSQSHHFPGGKEQLAVEALRESSDRYESMLRAAFERMHPADAVTAWSRAASAALRGSDWADGCPLATVALETAHSSDALASTCDAAFTKWTRALADAMTARGLPRREATRLATFALAAVEGALVLARAKRDPGPLVAVAGELAALLRERVP